MTSLLFPCSKRKFRQNFILTIEAISALCYNVNMIDINDVWNDTLSQLAAHVSANNYSLWLERLSPYVVKDNVLYLTAVDRVKKQTEKVYLPQIKTALNKVCPSFSDVKILLPEEADALGAGDDFFSGELVIKTEKKEEKSAFLPKYTFDTLVVGESNQMAYHAARAVSENPGSNDRFINFNPLFVYGGVGLGKTHLLHSVGNYIHKNYPSLKIVYHTSEQLINSFYNALQASNKTKSMNDFRSFYHNIDVLIIDDIQFLAGKKELQNVFFHIFNELYQLGKQIILSSDRHPKEIETLEDRLISRFSGGLMADIGQPGLEMRVAILKKKMQFEKIAVNNDVVYYIAERIDSNVRELEGALLKVILYAQLIGKPYPDLDTAKEALKIADNGKNEDIDSTKIIDAVSDYYRIGKNELLSKKKTKEISDARMIAIYLVHELLSLPLVTIGQLFGGRDHTTIIHARDKISQKLKDDERTKREIQDIKSMLSISG